MKKRAGSFFHIGESPRGFSYVKHPEIILSEKKRAGPFFHIGESLWGFSYVKHPEILLYGKRANTFSTSGIQVDVRGIAVRVQPGYSRGGQPGQGRSSDSAERRVRVRAQRSSSACNLSSVEPMGILLYEG